MGLTFVSYTLSSAEVPGRWSLVLFLPWCNFRCRHCHNWEIVVGKERASIREGDVLWEISSNPVIDAVVISGGEPTIYNPRRLKAFVERIKKGRPDIKVRVDTNGYSPSVVKELREVVDGFAIDIKAPISNPKLYAYTAGLSDVDTRRIIESVRYADGMPLTTYRTPKYPWLSEKDIKEVRRFVGPLSSPWSLNEFVEVPSCPFGS